MPSGSAWGHEATPVAADSSISTGTPDEMIELIRTASSRLPHPFGDSGTDIAADISRSTPSRRRRTARA